MLKIPFDYKHKPKYFTIGPVITAYLKFIIPNYNLSLDETKVSDITVDNT